MCKRSSRIVGPGLALGLALGAASAGALRADASAHPGADVEGTLPIEALRAGQRGHGLSVFRGGRPERFEVEILGVLRNFQAGADLILARLEGQGLERTGVIAGMSGSPVYVEGRLIGAVALGWAFSHEAIAGITPIAAMRELGLGAGGSAPVAGVGGGSRSVAGAGGEDFGDRLRELASGRIPAARWQEAWSRFRAGLPEEANSAVLWTAGGLPPDTRRLLERSLAAPVAFSGSLPAGDGPAGGEAAPTSLEPGAAVAAVLIDGDLRVASTGTVTERRDREVLAFGHPFLGSGAVEVPMAPADVVTVVSSAFNSFKLANIGRPVGRFDVDRRAGIRGELGRPPALVPLSVRVGERTFRLGVAPFPEMQPLLFALSLFGALDAAAHTGGRQGLSLAVRYALDPGGDLELRQDFDGAGAALDAAVYLLSASFLITQNPFAPVDVRAVEVDVERADAPREATLLAAHPARTRVGPGETVEIRLDLRHVDGATFRRAIEVPVPEEAEDGKYAVFVGSGPAVDAVRLGLETAPPQTLEQFLGLLGGLSARRDLVAIGVLPARGAAAGGELLPRLPSSWRSIFAAGGSGPVPGSPGAAAAAGPGMALRTAVAARAVRRLEVPIDGALRVEIDVRRRTGEDS